MQPNQTKQTIPNHIKKNYLKESYPQWKVTKKEDHLKIKEIRPQDKFIERQNKQLMQCDSVKYKFNIVWQFDRNFKSE